MVAAPMMVVNLVNIVELLLLMMEVVLKKGVGSC